MSELVTLSDMIPSIVHVVEGNQPAQAEFLRDCAPGWTAMQGGWGSGKTWAGARKFLALHLLNRCPGMVVAPTHEALWLLCVPELTRACDQYGLVYTTHPHGKGERKKPHMLIEGEPVWLFSADAPESIAGVEVGHIWGDEYARYPASREDPLRNAAIQIRGRLRHPKAKSLHGCFTSTPEGTDTPLERDFADPATRKADHRLYVAKTKDNAALPAGYIESLRGSIPAELIDQYLDGKAVNYVANRAHLTFSRAANVGPVEWKRGLPLHIGCDYNVSPMAWIAFYHIAGQIHVVDELWLDDFGQVDVAMHTAHRKGWGGTKDDPTFVVFHPDKSAKARSTVGDPEFHVMTATATLLGWNYGGNAAGVNPPVDARINLLSRMVRDANGKTRLHIDPRCTHLISDFESTARGSSGYDPGAEGKRGHILDALGYGVWDVEEPMGRASAIPL